MPRTRLSLIACIALAACGGIAVVDSGHGTGGGTTSTGGSPGWGGTPIGSGGWVAGGGSPVGGWINTGGAPIGGWVSAGGAPIGAWGGMTVVGGWIGAGGSTASGGCATYSPELAGCPRLVSCLKTFCPKEMDTCFGPTWTSGWAYAGACNKQLSCEDSCGCTTYCNTGCQDASCGRCQNVVSNCVVTNCPSEASACSGTGAGGSTGMGGSTGGYTCADLKYCCAVAPPTVQSACMQVLNAAYPSGDKVCSQVLVALKSYYCP